MSMPRSLPTAVRSAFQALIQQLRPSVMAAVPVETPGRYSGRRTAISRVRSAREINGVEGITLSLPGAAVDRATHGFVHDDGIVFQDRSDRPLENGPGLLIAGECGDLGGLGAGEVALVLDDVE